MDDEKERLMRSAVRATAMANSDFPKVGAFIKVSGLRVEGYNVCIDEAFEEDAKNGNKHLYIIHAEAGAIAKAASEGISTLGGEMYVTGKCVCHECAKLIIAAGIAKVYCPEPDANSKWVESNKLALKMFEEAGVEVEHSEILKGIEAGLTTACRY